MYIEKSLRPFWDQFIDPFLAALLRVMPDGKQLVPITRSGLTYALSRIVWAIYNKFPTATVASDLCAALEDVRSEFIRRKVWNQHELNLIQHGDLPEGEDCVGQPPIAGTKTYNATSEPVNIQSIPKGAISLGDIKDSKIVSLDQVNECIKAGKPLWSLLEIGATKIQPKAPAEPIVKDPSEESDLEVALTRALKALSLAQTSNATPDVLRGLQERVTSLTAKLLATYRANNQKLS